MWQENRDEEEYRCQGLKLGGREGGGGRVNQKWGCSKKSYGNLFFYETIKI